MARPLRGLRGRPWPPAALGLFLLWAVFSPPPSWGEADRPPYWEAAYKYNMVDALNAGLPRAGNPPDLETPQAAVENFVDSCRVGDDLRAARSLNLNAIAPPRQVELGKQLARKLWVVMNQQVWFKWSDVPDRPDGRDEDEAVAKDRDSAPKGPRPSFLLYWVFIGDRDYEIRLERIKAADAQPVWVFSRQTVRHIPILYKKFHPTRLEQSLPAFLKHRKVAKVALWQWIGFAVLLLAGALFGWMVQKGLNLVLRWRDSPWARTVAEAVRGPGALTVGLCIFYYLSRSYLGLSGTIQSALAPFYVAIVTACLVWFLQRLIRLITALIMRRYAGHDSDEANVLITRIAVTRHLLTLLVVIGGATYALSKFELVRRFGMMILASAGVAGIVLGVAAQRVLGNLFAGFLLGIVQPVKAGDALIFENEFGWIEEITTTHLVIRTWDQRRLVVPTSYFMDHPFQNWSRGTQKITKSVMLHADYRTDVEAVRAELRSILEGTDLWDREVPPVLQVIECERESIVLRALCSGRDPAGSWDLHCLVRERLITFLQGLDGGRSLPRRRVELVDAARPDGAGGGHPDEAEALGDGVVPDRDRHHVG
ncbi:MAG: mechanosensitive ion channel family protein [Planctomycetaceae bacterium]|nr:mechanosensitive ion channel family protein [Planctomycetaceae bacterium]